MHLVVKDCTSIMARRWPTQSVGPPENGMKAAVRPSCASAAVGIHFVLRVSEPLPLMYGSAAPALPHAAAGPRRDEARVASPASRAHEEKQAELQVVKQWARAAA